MDGLNILLEALGEVLLGRFSWRGKMHVEDLPAWIHWWGRMCDLDFCYHSGGYRLGVPAGEIHESSDVFCAVLFRLERICALSESSLALVSESWSVDQVFRFGAWGTKPVHVHTRHQEVMSGTERSFWYRET
jgi:hypothetical protein